MYVCMVKKGNLRVLCMCMCSVGICTCMCIYDKVNVDVYSSIEGIADTFLRQWVRQVVDGIYFWV